MLGKILLTLAVIAIAYLYVRQQQISASNETETNEHHRAAGNSGKSEQDELAKDVRLGAWLFLFLMTGVGGALFYFDWQDDRQILTINLHRESQAEPVSYQVYKYQLQDRSFTTVDGIQITVASSERMEIIGLDQ